MIRHLLRLRVTINHRTPLFLAGVLCALLAVASSSGQDADHRHGVEQRGDQGMGFSHQKTTHHFTLMKDGGAIEVEADDPSDRQSRDAIREHLNHIVMMFRSGDFDIPMFIHATTPPGVAVMKQRRERIAYDAQPTARGAEVRIQTSDRQALRAIHDFLRFQIRDHHTGDPLNVRN